MKKHKRVLTSISLLCASLLLLSLGYAFSSLYLVNKADDANIDIDGVIRKLGDDPYYLFWGDDSPVALQKKSDSDTEYAYAPNVTSIGDYHYKITDNYGRTLFTQDTFNLDITGTFDLTFSDENKANHSYASSLTYSFTLKDEGTAFGNSPYCYPASSAIIPVDWWVAGSFRSWDRADAIRMVANSSASATNPDKGMAQHIYLQEGETFKVTNYGSNWLGYSALKYGDALANFVNDASDNIQVKAGATDYYDIYLNDSNEISISKSTSLETSDTHAKIAATQYDSSSKTASFTLDATKYASSSTYLSFSNEENTKASEGVKCSLALSSANDATCSLQRYVYLKPGVWDTASAWFMAQVSGNYMDTTMVQMEPYASDESFYRMAVSTGYGTALFYRMNSNYDLTQVKDNPTWWKSESEGGYWWNMANTLKGEGSSGISISSSQAFQITGWGSNGMSDCEIDTSIATAPFFTAIAI